MIAIHCTFRVDPSARAAYDDTSCRQAAGCRTEAGNLAYEYSADVCDPTLVYNYQLWESQEALTAHSARPGVQERHDYLASLGVEVVEIMYLTVSDVRLLPAKL
jgi:quinol monooxygenase YgiN